MWPPPDNPLAASATPPQARRDLILVHQQPQRPPATNYPAHNPSPIPSYIPNPATVADPYAPHGGNSAGYCYASSSGAEAIQQYVIQPGTYGTPVVALGPPNGLNPAVPHQSLPGQYELHINYERGLKKGSHMSKMAQSAYCEVCKIECNSRQMLDNHKQGKKHKKNLQKLQEAITPRPNEVVKPTNMEALVAEVALGPLNGLNPAVPHQSLPGQYELHINYERGIKMGSHMSKMAQSAYCEVCKIECNSRQVLETHKQGKKHKKNLQKMQEAITP